MSLKRETEIAWFVRLGFAQALPNLPRQDHLSALLKLIQNNQSLMQALFGTDDAICQLIDKAQELYDLAFLIENYLRLKGASTLEGSPLNRL